MARARQRLTREARQAQVLALLRREGTVRIATLAKAFDVTTETARRDLDEDLTGGEGQMPFGVQLRRQRPQRPGRVHRPGRGHDRGLAGDGGRLVLHQS